LRELENQKRVSGVGFDRDAYHCDVVSPHGRGGGAQLMLISDAAHIAQVSERTIRTWVADRHVQSRLVNNRRYVNFAQVSDRVRIRERAGSARPRWQDFTACLSRVC
jgi:hypothetical protein